MNPNIEQLFFFHMSGHIQALHKHTEQDDTLSARRATANVFISSSGFLCAVILPVG